MLITIYRWERGGEKERGGERGGKIDVGSGGEKEDYKCKELEFKIKHNITYPTRNDQYLNTCT